MNFGDVVKYRNKEYVYLNILDEIMYLAMVPNEALSGLWIKKFEKVFMNGGKSAAKKKSWTEWCFIQLSTEQFKNRIAMYALPGLDYNPDDFMDTIGTLNKQDKIELQKEIINESAVSIQLKESVKQLDLEHIE